MKTRRKKLTGTAALIANDPKVASDMGRRGYLAAKENYTKRHRSKFAKKGWKDRGMTVKDVAKRLGMTRQAIHQKIASGEIIPPPFKKFGRDRVRIWTEVDILNILKAREAAQLKSRTCQA